MRYPTTSIVVAQVVGPEILIESIGTCINKIYAITKMHDNIGENKWVNSFQWVKPIDFSQWANLSYQPCIYNNSYH